MLRAVSFRKPVWPVTTLSLRYCSKNLVGSVLPNAKVYVWSNGPQETDSSRLFENRKVVLFAIPGAYSPTCEMKHVPGYVDKIDKFQEAGYDVLCLSVNDPYVLQAFAKITRANKLRMVSDSDGSFVTALGKSMKGPLGMGTRAKRFALIAENGKIKHFVEEDDPGKVEKTSAEEMLKAI